MSVEHDAAASMKVFKCKTCNRQFPTFQALGGHSASHRKTRSTASEVEGKMVKARAHECPICGLEFAVGQALGGHMRRHRPMTTMKTEEKGMMWMDLNLTPVEDDLEPTHFVVWNTGMTNPSVRLQATPSPQVPAQQFFSPERVVRAALKGNRTRSGFSRPRSPSPTELSPTMYANKH